MEVERITHQDPAEFTSWFLGLLLPPKQGASLLQQFDLLKAHGLHWGKQHVRTMDGNLLELKYKTFRLYFRYTDKEARFIHYGTKAQQKRDIEKAKRLP